MQIYPSSRFKAALASSHLYAVKMEIWDTGGCIYTIETLEDQDDAPNIARIVDGSITQDKRSDIRQQCSVKIIDPSGKLIPQGNEGDLTPWGNEIRLYIGIAYPEPGATLSNNQPVTEGAVYGGGDYGTDSYGGDPVNIPTLTGTIGLTTEYVQMGVFRISKVAINETKGAPTLTVTGYDRSRNVSRNVVQLYWPTNGEYQALENQSFAFGIQHMIKDRYPAAVCDASIATWTSYQNDQTAIFPKIPQTQTQGTDLWSIAKQYAQAVGCDLFVNRQGVFQMYRDPSFANTSGPYSPAPVAAFTEGVNATFQEIERDLDDSVAYNMVIVFGEGTTLEGSFASVPAVDSDPLSPTYFGPAPTQTIALGNQILSVGRYGCVPNIVTSNVLVTQAQIDDYAQLLLRIAIGNQQAVQIPSLACNPCLDVDDLITVTRLRDGVANNDITYIIDSVTFPLSPTGTMQFKLREKRNLQT
jgi:hypothetical protein